MLGGEITRLIVKDFGANFFVERLADPYWLSCLSCVLGFEWDTSGQTTVTLMALKEALSNRSLGVGIAGGKGRLMIRVRDEIRQMLGKLGRTDMAEPLERASALSCKIDNNALQDSYNVYFHAVAVSATAHQR